MKSGPNSEGRDCLRNTREDLREDLVEELADGSVGLEGGVPVVLGAGQVGVGKSNSPERRVAQNIARRRLSVQTEKEARLRSHEGMPPAIQDNSRDVAAGIE